MNEEQQRILEYLNDNAIGFENRRTSSEIRDDLKLESGGPTNEHVRDLIRKMVLNHQCLIGSKMHVDGYWIIQNQQELDEVTRSLEKRAESITNRANILRQNWQNQNG